MLRPNSRSQSRPGGDQCKKRVRDCKRVRECVALALTWVKRRCLREILWFLGFTDSLCLAAVLSRHGVHCGTASRLIDSMVPVGGRTLLDLGDLRGGLCSGACWLAS